jgi:hypothetical protein
MFEVQFPLTSGAMTMRKIPISVASLCLLVAALAAPLTAQGGGKKKHPVDSSQTVQSEQTIKVGQAAEAALVETTGTQHAGPTTGPIVKHWEFRDKAGSVHLTINQNGSYVFSGNYDNKTPDQYIEVGIGLEMGSVFFPDVFRWQYLGNVSKGGVKWNVKGRNSYLAQDFREFASSHVWGAGYLFVPVATVKAERQYEKQQLKDECRDDSWMNKQQWARVDPGKVCHQFNKNWD